jgi:cell division cycle 14
MEFQPFRDAGYGRADFYLTMQDVLWGIYRARSLSLFDLTTFNLDEYEHFEQVQNGDWNWITPQFIAFASPNDKEYVRELALMAQAQAQGLNVVSNSPYRKNAGPPQNVKNVIDAFKNRNVKTVVRLNNPLYDKDMFEQQGMEHLVSLDTMSVYAPPPPDAEPYSLTGTLL